MSLFLKSDSFYDRNLIDVLSLKKVIDSNLEQEKFFNEVLEALRGRSDHRKTLNVWEALWRMVHPLPQSIDRKHPAVLVNDAALVLPHAFCTLHFSKFHRIFTLVSFGNTIITTLQLI